MWFIKRLAAGLLGLIGFLYLRLCCATSRFHFTSSADEALRRSLESGIATVFVCWHDEFLISLIGVQQARFSRVSFITNDSFGGVFLETFCRCFGNRHYIIPRRASREERIDGMATELCNNGCLALAADYGKPWYKARPTASQLARRANGCVVPIRIEPKHRLCVKLGDRRAYLPLPFSEYVMWAAAPFHPDERSLFDASQIDDELRALQDCACSSEQERAASAPVRS